MDQRVPLRFVAIALVAGVALTGCGRKGPLEPAAAGATTPSNDVAKQARFLPGDDNPGLIQPPNRSNGTGSGDGPAAQSAPPATKKPFLLDPLL